MKVAQIREVAMKERQTWPDSRDNITSPFASTQLLQPLSQLQAHKRPWARTAQLSIFHIPDPQKPGGKKMNIVVLSY